MPYASNLKLIYKDIWKNPLDKLNKINLIWNSFPRLGSIDDK